MKSRSFLILIGSIDALFDKNVDMYSNCKQEFNQNSSSHPLVSSEAGIDSGVNLNQCSVIRSAHYMELKEHLSKLEVSQELWIDG